MSTSDQGALPKPEELIIWGHTQWTASDQQDVTDTVEWLLSSTVAVLESADPEMQMHKTLRKIKQRVKDPGSRGSSLVL